VRVQKIKLTMAISLLFSVNATGFQTEQRVALSEPAVAMDANGTPALEGNLRTTSLNGAPDSPVTDIRVVVKNVSPVFYAYVSGLVTFYDGAGVRCGEGIFKADALAPNESFESDVPGIRIKCAPSTWRLVATHLVPRTPPGPAAPPEGPGSSSLRANLLISVDGEEHPIQLGKPMVLTLGNKERTLVVRVAP
jgi:hypothetical protein